MIVVHGNTGRIVSNQPIGRVSRNAAVERPASKDWTLSNDSVAFFPKQLGS
jgi:hypothetical protein